MTATIKAPIGRVTGGTFDEAHIVCTLRISRSFLFVSAIQCEERSGIERGPREGWWLTNPVMKTLVFYFFDTIASTVSATLRTDSCVSAVA